MRSKRYHFNDDDDAKNATVKLASILFDQYSLHGTRDDLSANDIMTIIAACLQHSAELTASRRTFNDPLLAEAIRVLVPVIHDSPARPLIDFLTLLSQKKEALPNTSELNVYSPLSQLSSSILSTLSITTIITPTSNNHMKDITLALKAMARLDWYSTRCITSMIDALMTTRLTSSSMEYVGDLGVKRLASTPEEEALQSLSAADWIKAFQVHLAPAIEGPPHIKRELVHDADIKKFIEDNASFS
ncbi:hypothetical protein FOL46_008917, partial [Perkinsus olseni]